MIPHVKTFQKAHYQTADKRIKDAADFALFIQKSPYNGCRLQNIVTFKRFSWI